MKIDYLIHILENKILTLQQQQTVAENYGDIEAIVKIEQEIEETQNTINKLKL